MTSRNKVPFYRLAVFKVLLFQAAIVCVLGLIFLLARGSVAGYSALLGGLTALVPNAFFSFKAFRYYGARSIQSILQSFWAGEVGKMILTAAFFAVLFIGVKPLDILAVFTVFVAVQISAAASLLLMKAF